MRLPRVALVVLLFAVALPAPALVFAQEAAQAATPAAASAPALTRDEMRTFLQKAKVIKSRDLGKGVTRPLQLTLTDGATTHDAVFQSIDDRATVANLRGAKGPNVELNFVDSYRYNLAAEALATMVGLDHMIPVHARRSWNGKTGSLSWWVDSLMDEQDRLKKGVKPPRPGEWNEQMYRMRVFGVLTRDTDRNLTNVLITPEWKVVMIDFTRAFRLHKDLPYPQDLQRCDRALLAAMKTLTKEGIKAAVKNDLSGSEIDAVIARRDLLVAHFERLIAEKGEKEVLY